MGTFHMAILLLFNSSDSLKMSDIMEHTKLAEAELRKQIQTLTETKIAVVEVGSSIFTFKDEIKSMCVPFNKGEDNT